jgi:16S rRNA processing protein RimM
VRPLTDRPEERFGALRDCVLWDPRPDRREPCRITSCRFERLTGRFLAVAREDVLPAPEGSFYPWEMAGAAVETPDGRRVGEFVRVEGTEAQPLWVVAENGREHLVPAVPEIVVEVNRAERRIVFDPPEGLLEL